MGCVCERRSCDSPRSHLGSRVYYFVFGCVVQVALQTAIYKDVVSNVIPRSCPESMLSLKLGVVRRGRTSGVARSCLLTPSSSVRPGHLLRHLACLPDCVRALDMPPRPCPEQLRLTLSVHSWILGPPGFGILPQFAVRVQPSMTCSAVLNRRRSATGAAPSRVVRPAGEVYLRPVHPEGERTHEWTSDAIGRRESASPPHSKHMARLPVRSTGCTWRTTSSALA